MTTTFVTTESIMMPLGKIKMHISGSVPKVEASGSENLYPTLDKICKLLRCSGGSRDG